MIGPLDSATDECRALRNAFNAELRACITKRQADADARAGRATQVNSQTNRARYITCSAEIRTRFGVVSK
jgi:hypothetical protein